MDDRQTAVREAIARRSRVPVPKAHHLDSRADEIAAKGSGGDPHELLRQVAVAAWLGVSMQWLEIGRHAGYGPPFIRIGRMVRYRRSDVIAWLDSRLHQCTSEYSKQPDEAA